MSIPGFTAEASLGPTVGKYRANTAFGRSDTINLIPSQQIRASSITGQNLGWWPPIWYLARCCGPLPPYGGRIECVYQWVPIFYACECTQTLFGPSLFCHPPVVIP
jgi:hypothetical protein